MKRFALNLVLGVALAAGSSVAGATTDNPQIKNNSTTIGGLTATVMCALGFGSFCADIDTTNDPQIKNN